MTESRNEMWNEIREAIMEALNFTDEVTDEQVLEVIDRILKMPRYSKKISLARRCALRTELFHSIRKLDILEELLEDDDVTEIMINGEKGIFLERKGQLEAFTGGKIPMERLEDLVIKITGMSNRMINEASPLADARLRDGSRVHMAISPVALDGVVITIRKFPKRAIELKDLLEKKSLNEEMADFLKKAVAAKYNIFVSGSTGSGKTTLLNVLSDFIPENERVITIEDTAELQIRKVPNLVRLEARAASVEGCREISIRDLLRHSLRMRPDRLIVGEVRGAEAVDMIQALCTGHAGSMSTGHGNSTKDMLGRLETMILMGMDIPLQTVRRQLASGIDLLIHLGRLKDKRRVILEISEITGFLNGEILLNVLYRFDESGTGTWKKEGTLQKKDKLIAAGVEDADRL